MKNRVFNNSTNLSFSLIIVGVIAALCYCSLKGCFIFDLYSEFNLNSLFIFNSLSKSSKRNRDRINNNDNNFNKDISNNLRNNHNNSNNSNNNNNNKDKFKQIILNIISLIFIVFILYNFIYSLNLYKFYGIMISFVISFLFTSFVLNNFTYSKNKFVKFVQKTIFNILILVLVVSTCYYLNLIPEAQCHGDDIYNQDSRGQNSDVRSNNNLNSDNSNVSSNTDSNISNLVGDG